MLRTRSWRTRIFSQVGVLILLGLARIPLPLLNNPQSGWDRDALGMLDHAQALPWGYVSYPPMAPFLARIALVLFGPSLIGMRLFASLAIAAVMALAGLIARELGGGRLAQALAALATGISPIQLLAGTMISYSSFDCLWWVSTAYLVIRLLKSADARWWLAIGLVFGLGMMTKHLFAILIAGVVIGVLLAPARRFLRTPWLWAGAALCLFLILPNLAWQIRHGFISLELMRWIHGRGVLIGRTASFIPEQFYFSANLAAIPVWIAGLVICLAGGRSQKFRILAWMGVIPLALRSTYRAAHTIWPRHTRCSSQPAPWSPNPGWPGSHLAAPALRASSDPWFWRQADGLRRDRAPGRTRELGLVGCRQ